MYVIETPIWKGTWSLKYIIIYWVYYKISLNNTLKTYTQTFIMTEHSTYFYILAVKIQLASQAKGTMQYAGHEYLSTDAYVVLKTCIVINFESSQGLPFTRRATKCTFWLRVVRIY